MRARRAAEHRRPYFADRFPATLFALIVAMLILCVVDAVLTLELLPRGGAEFNPLMGCLLERGIRPFLIGKYVLTAAGMPLLLIFKNHYLFGTRFRVGYLIPIIVALYLGLIAYQTLLMAGIPRGQAAAAAVNRRPGRDWPRRVDAYRCLNRDAAGPQQPLSARASSAPISREGGHRRDARPHAPPLRPTAFSCEPIAA